MEDEDQLKPGAAPKAGMSNEDMLGFAIAALAPALFGGAIGGKQGALAGGAAGAGAVGNAMTQRAQTQSKAEADAKARTAEMEDFKKKEDYKATKNPKEPKAPGTRAVKYTKDGKEITEIVEDKPGAKFESEPKPPKDTSVVDPKELRNASMQARNKFTQEARPYTTAINSAKSTEELAGMAKTNPRAAGALVGKLARAAGEVGVLSDQDIARLGGAASFQERLERFALLSTTDQKITDDDIRSAQELAQVMAASAQGNLDALTESQVNSFVSIYGGTRDEAYRKITGLEPKPTKLSSPGAVGATNPVDEMTDDEVDAALKARGM